MAQAIPGVIGAVVAQDQNRRAANQQQQALNMQNEVLRRRNELFDQLKGLIAQADSNGVYDPQKRWESARAVMDFDQKRAQEASAGASAALGYRPGDTAPLDAQKGISESYGIKRGALQNDIFRQSWADKLGAYQGLLGDVPMEGLNVGAQRYGMAQNQMQDMSGLFSALMPLFQGGAKTSQPTQNVSPVWGYNGLYGNQSANPWKR